MPKITRHATGKFLMTIQLNGTRKYIYGATEKEVEARYIALQREIGQKGLADPSRRTVNDLLDEWLETIQSLQARTRQTYADTCRRHIRPELGKLRLSKLTPSVVQHFYNQMVASGLKREPQRVHATLHRALEFARVWNYITENPTDRVMKPTYQAPSKEIWNKDEMTRFVASTADHSLHNLWVFIMTSGLRMSELNALKWDHIRDNQLTVDKSTQRIAGVGWVEKGPKSKAGLRTITIPEMGRLALARQKQQNQTRKHGPRYVEQGYVFPGRDGGPIDKSYVDRETAKMCLVLGLPPLTPHGMRHFHGSHLIDQGIPITTVSARLGHSSPIVTTRVYAHAISGHDQSAADAIDRVFRPT